MLNVRCGKFGEEQGGGLRYPQQGKQSQQLSGNCEHRARSWMMLKRPVPRKPDGRRALAERLDVVKWVRLRQDRGWS